MKLFDQKFDLKEGDEVVVKCDSKQIYSYTHSGPTKVIRIRLDLEDKEA
jgi:hypothetical protein